MNIDKWKKVSLLCIVLSMACWHKTTGAADGSNPTVLGGENQYIEDIVIEITNRPPYETNWQGIARSLIRFKKGDRFQPLRLEETLENLKLCKQFKEIHVDSTETDRKIRLIFQLTPFHLIKDLKIKGNYPFFKRELTNIMTISPGDVYQEEKLLEQKNLLTQRFKQEGFIDPQVDALGRLDEADGYYTVDVHVRKGPYYKLDRFEMEGNEQISETRLKMKMKIWRQSVLPFIAGRYRDKVLKEDLKRLQQYYWEKGFFDCKLSHEVKKNPGDAKVYLSIRIDEGARYEVAFSGNKELSNRTLKKELILYKQGGQNGRGLRKSLRNLKKRYQNEGYVEAGIEAEIKEISKKLKALTFKIKEGPCTTVEAVTLKGNIFLKDEDMKKQIITTPPRFLNKGVFIPDVLEEDLVAVQSIYLKHGFMKTKVKEDVVWREDKSKVNIGIDIEEGLRTIISSVSIMGNTTVSGEELKKVVRLSPGEPFREYMVKSDENALAAHISEKGFPHVKVNGETFFAADNANVDIVYRIEQGPYVEMDQFYYRGNFRTKKRIIQNEMGLDQGMPFSMKKLLEGQRNIRNMAIFDSVQFKVLGLKEKRDKVNLFTEIEEKKPYYMQFGLGYESDTGAYGKFKLGDHNLFGTNKEASISGEISQTGYEVKAGIIEPRLFGTRISTVFDLYTERKEEFNQNFGTTVFGSSIGFSKRFSRNLTGALGFRVEQREQFKLDTWAPTPGVNEGDLFAPRTILATTPSLSYDTRDSFIRPRKGLFSSVSMDVSKGLEKSLDDFIRPQIDIRYYLTPIRRITFAWLGRIGFVESYNADDTVPNDQLFYLGGTGDVRGFDENLLRYDINGDPVGGRTAIVGSLEARIDLGKNFEMTLFYDTGKLSRTADSNDSNNFRSTIGVGLRYITAIGPVGILYGHKLDKKDGEDAGRFHFSIGYTF